MRTWFLNYRRGLRLLSRHQPKCAVDELRIAADACPSSERRDLARILYYLGLALERTGHPSLAVKSWCSARRLERGGAIGRLHARWVNEYGMRRMADQDADDYSAFKAAQVARYLSKRGSGKFGSRAERDVVVEIIVDAWRLIHRSGFLRGLSVARKLELFRQANVEFPFLFLEDAIEGSRPPIPGNFRGSAVRGARVRTDDRCPCGSGLPYCRCCGRQASCVETEYGSH